MNFPHFPMGNPLAFSFQGTSPQGDLGFPVTLHGFGLGQTLKATRVACVELPTLVHLGRSLRDHRVPVFHGKIRGNRGKDGKIPRFYRG